MSDFARMLLGLSLGGGLLAVLLLGIKTLFKNKLPSTFYYYAWLLVLLRFTLPVPGFLSLAPERTAAASQPVEASDTAPGTARQIARSGGTSVTEEASYASDTNKSGGAETVYSQSEQTQPKASSEESPVRTRLVQLLKSGEVLLWLWAAGATVSALRYVVGYARFSGKLRETLIPATEQDKRVFSALSGPERLALCRSAGVKSPMLLGVLHPLLVLPDRGYTDRMLENILSHELTHYRRGDIVYKWFAVLVYSLHWFNPITALVRREMDRDCELSCDEWLLRRMDIDDKQSYGETILSLAADRALPRRVVATSFATEKRNLKERLEQIMTYKNRGRATLALMLTALLVLGGCGTALGPQATAEPTATPAAESAAPETASGGTAEPETVEVKTVDEFLGAIAPNTTIVFAPGAYDLSTASDYAQPGAENYEWVDAYDGFALYIEDIDGLTLTAEEPDTVTIEAVPRYANVLYLSSCDDFSISRLTLGHTKEPGQCAGGVLKFSGCERVSVDACKLFGCGILGVDAFDCRTVRVTGTEIYECSQGAANIESCRDVLFDQCKVYKCEGYNGVFTFTGSNECAVTNSEIYDNTASTLMYSSYSQGIYMGATNVYDNKVELAMFTFNPYPVTIEGCALSKNSYTDWYGQDYYGLADSALAVSPDGTELDGAELAAMTLSDKVSWEAKPKEDILNEVTLEASEDGAVHVSTVDEFLAAIAPDTTIYLEPGTYNLHEAANYGSVSGDWYQWLQNYDGPSLVIAGVKNLTIMAESPDKVTIATSPRYADVLSFSDCENITLSGITAGHTEAPGSCTGGVLNLAQTNTVRIENCSLFGCGILGISAYNCEGIDVAATEIHDCSQGAVYLSDCRDVAFSSCDIHGNTHNSIDTYECVNTTIDGELLPEGTTSATVS